MTGGAATATLLRPKQETIPPELKARNQWVPWRLEIREGKPTKVPYVTPDRRASSTDAGTWLSFDAAWALYERGGFDGVGYVFAADDPYCGIDLDPELPAKDRETITQRFGSYAELSPSGKGQHIIVRAQLPKGGKKKGPLEIYDRGRYFTFTGHAVEGASMVIEERQEAVDWLLATYFERQRDTPSNTNGGGLNATDDELLDKAFAASNGDKLRRLWNGDTTDYPSASEADMALGSKLAFWTGPDAMKLETLMRSSGLAREKWDTRHYGDGQTYLEAVVTKALSGRTEFYAAGNHAAGNSNGDPLDPLRALADSPTAVDIEAALREAVTRLGRMDSLRLQAIRQEMIVLLKTRKVSGAARYVEAALSLIADKGGTDGDLTDFLADPEPWNEPVSGAALLDTISSGVMRRYMVMTKEQADTCALWVVFAHSHDASQVSPILAVQSPVMGCGKSRLQATLVPMLPRALAVCNLGVATLFRTVEHYQPTLVIDEADTFMQENEGLRGIVNSGWLRSGARTIRLVGDDHETKIFSTWCPKVIAAIGKLPPTIQDRSIVIELKRKGRGETVQRFGIREAKELTPLCSKAARWATDNIEALREATPEVPDSLSDRQADSWTPLLAIAERAGGDWPDRARTAALILSGGERDPETDGAGVMLIADCVHVFEARGVDRLSTTDLRAELVKLEERPWPEWSKGKPITPRALAKLLKPFGIKPKVVRIGTDTPSGYELLSFHDAYSRYIPGSNPQHCQQINDFNELDPISNPQQTPNVEDTKSDLTIEKQRDVEDVEDRIPEKGPDACMDAVDEDFESRGAGEQSDLFDSEEVCVL